ncbi:MAG: NAD(P)-dependent oxidoreductase [Pseudomonadota bacterium]
MKILLTGATGYLGGFLTAEAQGQGDEVVTLSRREPAGGVAWLPFDLSAPPKSLPPADALVHAAFDHLPGRYRGGEGNDPDGFLSRNAKGSRTLFRAAQVAGIGRVVFLSTRAVYGAYPSGTTLTEDLVPQPDTLYGRMKWDLEQDLARLEGVAGVSLRVTGVYGEATPGGQHKWAELFTDFAAGREIAPRMGTEVHGTDFAAAVRTVLSAPRKAVADQCFNVSDLLVDRRDLLAGYARRAGLRRALPKRAPVPGPNVMDCSRLQRLGWQPGGQARLNAFLDEIAG